MSKITVIEINGIYSVTIDKITYVCTLQPRILTNIGNEPSTVQTFVDVSGNEIAYLQPIRISGNSKVELVPQDKKNTFIKDNKRYRVMPWKNPIQNFNGPKLVRKPNK